VGLESFRCMHAVWSAFLSAFAWSCASGTFCLCVLNVPVACAQDQVLLVDSTLDATGEDPNSMESRDGIALLDTVPADWTSPVDYRKGRVYVRVQILEKPSERSTLLTVCFYSKAQYQEIEDAQGNVTSVKGLTCTPYAGKYNTTQTLLGRPEIAAFWNKDGYDWSQKPDLVYIVLKNGDNEEFVRGDASFYPSKMQVTIALLAEGVQDYGEDGQSAGGAAAEAGTSASSTGDAGGDSSSGTAAGAGGVGSDDESSSAGAGGGGDLDRYVDPGSSCSAISMRARASGAAGYAVCAGTLLMFAFGLGVRSRRR